MIRPYMQQSLFLVSKLMWKREVDYRYPFSHEGNIHINLMLWSTHDAYSSPLMIVFFARRYVPPCKLSSPSPRWVPIARWQRIYLTLVIRVLSWLHSIRLHSTETGQFKVTMQTQTRYSCLLTINSLTSSCHSQSCTTPDQLFSIVGGAAWLAAMFNYLPTNPTHVNNRS